MISLLGVGALKRREGVVLTMYRDSAGLPTIGVGHLLTKDELASGKLWPGVYWHKGITAEQADKLLRQDLRWAEAAVNAVRVELTENQYDVLVSFVFNIGATAFRNSRLLRLLNAGNYDAVPAQLKRWIYSAGRVDPILVNRRKSEIRQWEAK